MSAKQSLLRAVLLTDVRRLARVISRRAHIRPAFQVVSANDNSEREWWPWEDWA